MKTGLSTLLIFITSFSTFGQIKNCDSLLNFYCESKPCIEDSVAFCRGVEIANKTNGLAIRSIGDPGHLSQCEFHSYSNYGVQLIMTGDIVYLEQEEENAGFNSVMIPRIKDSLGIKFELLGKMDSTWFDLSEQEFSLAISEIFEFEKQNDSTFKLILNPEKEINSIFKSLEGVRFADDYKNWVSRDSILEGFIFNIHENGCIYLMIDFTLYPNKNNICQAYGKYVVPIRIE